ncbi:MAG TPA: SusC/RagA family TonB-linked outer membrane protein [Bacteroidales bacterium]|nr:SusC/RagA family TonB-linked outer membrane protein [Bacteroidales bacterium]HSA44856.1 SusC/RagA family TonB-linked outer membrane protein [Bacteroidales bacterium]
MSRIIVICCLLMFSWSLHSQTLTVKGKVISGSDNQTIPGATVQVKDRQIATATDIDGVYVLKGVGTNDTLVFSFIGYARQLVAVKGRTVIDVTLEVTALELKEVVVTALGINRQKRELGFATEKIAGEIITRSSTSNIMTAISGRSAGVMVSAGDGVEGGSTRVIIRGNNNLGNKANNQPLIVIDGIPMENTPGLTDIGRGVDWGNAMNNINAFDIESYNILKGGAASALYGSRGANGVILITTKRGGQQKGIGLTYNMTHKITHPYRFREVQNKYGHGGPIAFTPPVFPTSPGGDTLLYPGIYSTDQLVINQQGETSSSAAEFGYYGGAVSWGPEMKGELIRWWDGSMRNWSPQPDNLKSAFHNGYTTTHNIAASGSGNNGTLRISITRQDHKPIVENSNFNQTTVNLGGNMKVSERLSADLSISYIDYHRLNSPLIGEEGNSFSKGYLYSWPRSYQGEDKEGYELPDGTQHLMENYPYYYVNPYLWWNYYNNNTTLDREKYLGSVSLVYDVNSWLNILVRAGRDFTLSQFETRHKPTDLLGLLNGYYSNSLQRDFSNNSEFLVTLTKDKVFNTPVNMKVSGGGSNWTRNYYSIDGRTGTWYYPNMYSMVNYTETTFSDSLENILIVDRQGDLLKKVAAGEAYSRRKTNSLYAFVNLAYKNYLFLDLTGRNDWSSTLPTDHNSYFYPSATLSLIATDAFASLKPYTWLSFLKVRASAAQTATDTDPYQTEFYYTTSFFGGQQTSYFPSKIPPYMLKPQRVNTYEGGLNVSFLDNKIDLDVTWYHSRSFDQILTLPLPLSSGASSIVINEGELTNRGIELMMNVVPYHGPKLMVKTGLNFARNRSRIVSLGDYADLYLLADIWGLNGPAMGVLEGEEYGTILGWDYVYHENGQPIVNDQGTKYLITENRVPIGNASPDFIAGWTTEWTYGNFRLSTLVDTKWGGDIYCGSYVIGLQTGQSPETLKERDGGGLPYTDPDGNTSNIGIILDGVYADGTPNNKVVHYYYKYLPNAGGWGEIISKPGILDNTWVKMREVSLSYTLPAKALRRLKAFQQLTLSVTGRDLFYIYSSLPDKINPEGIMGSGNAQGFEWASFPGTRSFIFGLNASF